MRPGLVVGEQRQDRRAGDRAERVEVVRALAPDGDDARLLGGERRRDEALGRGAARRRSRGGGARRGERARSDAGRASRPADRVVARGDAVGGQLVALAAAQEHRQAPVDRRSELDRAAAADRARDRADQDHASRMLVGLVGAAVEVEEVRGLAADGHDRRHRASARPRRRRPAAGLADRRAAPDGRAQAEEDGAGLALGLRGLQRLLARAGQRDGAGGRRHRRARGQQGDDHRYGARRADASMRPRFGRHPPHETANATPRSGRKKAAYPSNVRRLIRMSYARSRDGALALGGRCVDAARDGSRQPATLVRRAPHRARPRARARGRARDHRHRDPGRRRVHVGVPHRAARARAVRVAAGRRGRGGAVARARAGQRCLERVLRIGRPSPALRHGLPRGAAGRAQRALASQRARGSRADRSRPACRRRRTRAPRRHARRPGRGRHRPRRARPDDLRQPRRRAPARSHVDRRDPHRAPRRARRPLPDDARGRVADRRRRAARPPRGPRQGGRADAHAQREPRHRRRVLAADEGDGRARRGRAPAGGEHHRGRHGRQGDRAPPALPRGSRPAAGVVA